MNETKNVLITGATSGIGKSCAYTFAKKGYNLIITGRRKERLDEIKDFLQTEFNVKIQTLCFDVRNLEETKNAIESIDEKEFQHIDILINNAGLE